MRDDGWMTRAACLGLPEPEIDRIFYPEVPKGQPISISEAKTFCDRCPVRRSCLAYAIAHKIRHGVWGGYSERQRQALGREVKVQIRRKWFSIYPR